MIVPNTPLRTSNARARVVADLRRLLPRLEGASEKTLPFGIPALDERLQGGLALGALHAIVPDRPIDTPAALGFAAALLGRMAADGPVFLVTSPGGLVANSRLHGHGLHRVGLDPSRLILIEAGDDKEAFWAMEECLRSHAPAAVAGAIRAPLDLTMSRRLRLAAGDSGIPLLLLQPAGVTESGTALTRWRITAAPAARDAFGLITRLRWRLKLERCRNGRPGEWLVELDHAYRFSLAAAVADPASSHGENKRVRTG
jgi:protein ImuA